MDAKYILIIEDLVAKLYTQYMSHLNLSKDEYEYYAIVTGSLVFKELALLEFKKEILRESDDNPDDICQTMEAKAKEMAQTIHNRCLNTQQSLN